MKPLRLTSPVTRLRRMMERKFAQVAEIAEVSKTDHRRAFELSRALEEEMEKMRAEVQLAEKERRRLCNS